MPEKEAMKKILPREKVPVLKAYGRLWQQLQNSLNLLKHRTVHFKWVNCTILITSQ